MTSKLQNIRLFSGNITYYSVHGVVLKFKNMFIVINKHEFLLHIFLTSLSAKWVFFLPKHPFMNASFLSEFEIAADTKINDANHKA